MQTTPILSQGLTGSLIPSVISRFYSNFKTMSQTAAGYYRKEKWYNRNVFPLVPVITIKKADEHNTSAFTFRWLFFTIWTLDSFSFELSIVASTHWGIGFIGILPYLRWVVAIPCPERLGILIDRKLSRKCQSLNGL